MSVIIPHRTGKLSTQKTMVSTTGKLWHSQSSQYSMSVWMFTKDNLGNNFTLHPRFRFQISLANLGVCVEPVRTSDCSLEEPGKDRSLEILKFLKAGSGVAMSMQSFVVWGCIKHVTIKQLLWLSELQRSSGHHECIIFHDSPFYTGRCWDISAWTKVADPPTDTLLSLKTPENTPSANARAYWESGGS